jgi:methyl coenzyme M reductase alpha subunit
VGFTYIAVMAVGDLAVVAKVNDVVEVAPVIPARRRGSATRHAVSFRRDEP